jgi:hypothetical protein
MNVKFDGYTYDIDYSFIKNLYYITRYKDSKWKIGVSFLTEQEIFEEYKEFDYDKLKRFKSMKDGEKYIKRYVRRLKMIWYDRI